MSYDDWTGKDWDLEHCGSDSELLTDDVLNFVNETIGDTQEKRIRVKGLEEDDPWGIKCTYTEGTSSTPETVEGYHGAAEKKFKITRTKPAPTLQEPNPKWTLTCQWDPPPPPPAVKKDGGDDSDITWRALAGAG